MPVRPVPISALADHSIESPTLFLSDDPADDSADGTADGVADDGNDTAADGPGEL
jgi:hypothetical protein